MMGMRGTSSRARRILLPVCNVGVLLLLWQYAVDHQWIGRLSVSAPLATARLSVSSFAVLWPHIFVTAWATALTFVLS
jgi:ABC-type nitrate/sulfonate/bicarbonate transport system permease component